MNKFSILLVFIDAILCTYNDCTKEQGPSKNCGAIDTGLDEIKCFDAINLSPGYSNTDPEMKIFEIDTCFPLPTDKEKHKDYFEIIRHLEKDYSYFYKDSDILVHKIEYDAKKSNITLNFDKVLSESDKKIIYERNTCIYNAMTSSFQDSEDLKKQCFGSSKYEESKNLLRCGFASLTAEVNGKKENFKTCVTIPTLSTFNNKLLFYAYKGNLRYFFTPIKESFHAYAKPNQEEIKLDNKVTVLDSEGNRFLFSFDFSDFEDEKNLDYNVGIYIIKPIKIKINFCLDDESLSFKIIERKGKKNIFSSMKKKATLAIGLPALKLKRVLNINLQFLGEIALNDGKQEIIKKLKLMN